MSPRTFVRRALAGLCVLALLASPVMFPIASEAAASPASPASPAPPPGYWLAAADGGIFTFGGAPFVGSAGGMHVPAPVVGMAGTRSGRGYWLLGGDGAVYAFGDATPHGAGPHTGSAAAAIAALPDGSGYWIAQQSGRVSGFGRAATFPMGLVFASPSPIVAMAATADGGGYWLASASGGVYAFGDAPFFGSAGTLHLNKPIVGMAAMPDGGGYWLVASDGGIFSYGDAVFHGSTGAIRLNKPIVGMSSTPDGGGYWLVASDGGIFSYGNAPFRGSTGARRLNQPIVAMAATRASDPYPIGQQGYDISFPQCGGQLPATGFGFGIVGVNDGRAFTHNPCLDAEAQWAGPGMSVYMNLNEPATGSEPGAGQGATGPAGTCAPTQASCVAFNYGYNAAVDAFNYATSKGAVAGVWWLDIETANSWDANTANNDMTIQGALSALDTEGVVAGIYSTSHQWSVIAGGFAPATPIWVATGADRSTAVQYCDASHGFGGGPIWLTQYGTQGVPYDQDYACPTS